MKTLTVSTSDIEHLAVFSMSVDYSLKEKYLLHWWWSCSMRMTVILLHTDDLQCSMNHFVSACNWFRLKINLKKTIVMYDPAPGSPYIEPIWRCPWCNGYRRRNWTRRHEFISWTDWSSHSTNTLGKGIKPIILPPAMGK